MKLKGLISKVIPVLKVDGKIARNPLVITDRYVDDGEIVYGEFKRGDAAKEAKGLLKSGETDFTGLDKEVSSIIWKFTNLFPGCVMMSIDGIRAKKKFFWDQAKLSSRHWLMTNMNYEAFLGFGAFNTKKITGQDTVDFIKFRQNIADCKSWDMDMFAEVMGKPQE